ncbi:MAG TPA: chemotaxis protein CheA [Acidobacteriota bacterium]|nr:chemotaxis protein CheA [Acidobacteriota bacterium]
MAAKDKDKKSKKNKCVPKKSTKKKSPVIKQAAKPKSAGKGKATAASPNGNAVLVEKLNKLCEALVFAEPSDFPALTDILVRLEETAKLTAQAKMERASEAATSACKLIELLILEELEDPQKAMDAVGGTVSALLEIVRDGREADEVEFPSESATDVNHKVAEVSGLSGYKLPSHIDESIFSEFLERQTGNLDDLEALILHLEKMEDESKLGELRRMLHTLKGESALLGISEMERLCHAAEDMLNTVRPQQAIDALLAVKDWLGKAFTYLSTGESAPGDVNEVLSAMSLEAVEAAEPYPESEEEAPAVSQPRYLEGDLDLLGDFVTEARDHLDTADIHILTLETESEDAEALNAVFRAFHTIKGVAGFLALDEMGSLAHEAENLLDKARKGDLRLDGVAIDVTFDAVDMLKKLVGFVSYSLTTGEPLKSDSALPSLLRRIREVAAGRIPSASSPSDAPAADKLGHILVESGAASMESVEAALERQGKKPQQKRLGEILVESVATSKHKVERALAKQQDDPTETKIGEILVESGSIRSEDVEAALEKQKDEPKSERLGEILVRDGNASAREVAKALRTQRSGGITTVQVKETLKVDAERLDRLVDMIGELVIAESMVSQAVEVGKITSTEFSRHLQQLDKITRELQEMGTSLRMIPVRATFQKMARLVRDLSKKSGKQIDFRMTGENTELDKTVVDQIGDPLVHMVRNAVDHGIESDPEQRIKAGKPRFGRVELRAFHKGGSIFIEIEDDGRGLGREGITQKAIERGLIKSSEGMTDKEVFNLIFEPGFSTARKVTDVSGRGVGMDVVKRNIEALRGLVEIRSELGKGSIFTLRLPLTLAIIDGMVIRVGGERYIIPTLSVVRSIQPRKEDISTVFKRGEMLSVQGELIPLFRLSTLFRINDAEVDITKALVVVVEDDGKLAGLITDELVGQQQIVIKTLGGMLRNSPGLAGGAIMPDGKVGLILDVGGLVKLAYSEKGRSEIGGDADEQPAVEGHDTEKND